MQKIELNRIRVILEEKGISQTWLANKLGKSFSMVNAYTCNRRQPNLETLYQIANILKVSSINSIYPLVSDSRTL